MSASDFLTGSQEKLIKEDERYPWQVANWKELAEAAQPGAVSRLEQAGRPYPYKLGADPTSAQQWSFGALDDWLDSPMPMDDKLWGLSRDEYEKTLGGDYYDPAEGDYYKALKTNLLRELAEAKDRLHSTTSARDQYFSSGRVAGEGELEEDAVNQLAQIVAALMEKERMTRLGSIPGAMGLMAQEELYPQGRIEGAQAYGSQERDIELQNQQIKYGEWMRQLQDLGIPLEVAMKIAESVPQKDYPIYSFEPGYFGGPSGTSIQPTGGYGEASKFKDLVKGFASLLGGMGGGAGGAGGGGGGMGGMDISSLLQMFKGGGGGAGAQGGFSFGGSGM